MVGQNSPVFELRAEDLTLRLRPSRPDHEGWHSVFVEVSAESFCGTFSFQALGSELEQLLKTFQERSTMRLERSLRSDGKTTKAKKLIEQQPGERIRTNRAAAERALADLGVPLDSEFAQLYLAYKLLSFRSEVSGESLVNVVEPNRAVADGTRFAHEGWGLPDKYVAFTSMEGEGAYLYDRATGQVWDFELASREAFPDRQQPKWNSFFEFMKWYLGDPPGP